MVRETSRASWGLSYERGLVDILVEHNVPIYRGQNGWVAEGWRSITAKFNQKFPCAKYTKQHIQEKEKDMKANYKAFQQARKQSGTGWDDNLSMIIAEPVIWEKLKKDYPRVKKFEGKPFLLFPKLASLYEGSIATGDLNFLSIPQVDLTSDAATPTKSSADLNPFSTTHDGGQSSANMHGQAQEVEPCYKCKFWTERRRTCEKKEAKSDRSCARRLCRLSKENNSAVRRGAKRT